MKPTPETKPGTTAWPAAIARWDDQGGTIGALQLAPGADRAATETPSERRADNHRPVERSPSVTQLAVDEGPHSSDGLLLHGQDQSEQVSAFIGRKVMDEWVAVDRRGGRRPSLFRDEYNALAKHNLAAIGRVVNAKYARGLAFNRQHPFVDVLLSDIVDSGELLDTRPLDADGVALAAARP
jgi:hypothetical protein